MRLAALALLLGGCFFKPEPPAGTEPTFDAGRLDAPGVITGGTRRRVTIDLLPTSELTGVPINVVLSDNVDLGMAAALSSNIAFVLDDNVALPCEIVSYLPGVGVLDAWVRLPTLSASQSSFWIAYGPDVDASCDRDAMWEGFLGAWHFADVNVTNIARDSTRFGHDALRAGGSPFAGAGVTGSGLAVDHTDGADALCAMHETSLDPGMSSFSYEMWVHPAELVGEFDIAMSKGGMTQDDPGFDLELGMSTWVGNVRDAPDLSKDTILLTNAPDQAVGSWNHVAIVVDRTTNVITSFFNGNLVTSDNMPAQVTVSSTRSLCFGNSEMALASHAVFDEPRVHGVARIPAWFKVTYDNLMRRNESMHVDAPVAMD